MVSICAGCDGYYPWAAALVAAVAGAIYVVMSKLVASIKVDDPLDAVAVHAGAGLWGILAAPIFMETGVLIMSTLLLLTIVSRYSLHWLRVCYVDAGLERDRCWILHCVEHCLCYLDVWIPQGISILMLRLKQK